MTWLEICEHYPDQWVCLVDIAHIEHEISRARVVGHHHTIKEALRQVDPHAAADVLCSHTNNRGLRTPPRVAPEATA
jgi:hypothetical protein